MYITCHDTEAGVDLWCYWENKTHRIIIRSNCFYLTDDVKKSFYVTLPPPPYALIFSLVCSTLSAKSRARGDWLTEHLICVALWTQWRQLGIFIILYSWKIWHWIKFGSLAVYLYNCQIKILYLHVVILYQTTTFKSTNILAMVILGPNRQFNSCQYSRLYGIL